MKRKLCAVLLALISFFSTFSNISNFVVAQVPKVQVAYCTDGIEYQGKYRFWIVANPTMAPLYVTIPFHVENGLIEDVKNIYPSSIDIPTQVNEGFISISGQAVTSLTISGSSPVLTLNEGMDYYLTPVPMCEDIIEEVLSGTLVSILADLKPVEDAQNEYLNTVENAPLVLQGTGFDFDILKQLTELSYVAPLIIGGVIVAQEGIPAVVKTRHWWECVANFNDIQISQLPRDQWVGELSKIGFTKEEIPTALHILEMTQSDIAVLNTYHEATALSLANNAVNEVRKLPQITDSALRAAIDETFNIKTIDATWKPLTQQAVQSAHEYVTNPTPQNLKTYTNIATQATKENIDDVSQTVVEMAQRGVISGQVQSDISALVSQSSSVTPVISLSKTFFLNNYYNLITSTDTVSFVSIGGNTIWRLAPTAGAIPGMGEQGTFEYLAPRIVDAWANGNIDGIIPSAADIVGDVIGTWNLQLRGIVVANYPGKLAEFDRMNGIIRKSVQFVYTTDTSGLPIIQAINTKTGEVIAIPQMPDDYLSRMEQSGNEIKSKIGSLKDNGGFQQKLGAAEEAARQLQNSEVVGALENFKISSAIEQQLSYQGIIDAWKTDKITGVMNYIQSKYSGFATNHPNAIKIATGLFLAAYLILTGIIIFAPQIVPDWLLTAYTIVSWGLFLISVANLGIAFYAAVTTAIASGSGISGVLSAIGGVVVGNIWFFIGLGIASLIGMYGAYRAGEVCDGTIKVEPSKTKAQPEETIELRISGFSGPACPQRNVHLYESNPNAPGPTPQIITSSTNPAGTTLTFALPQTTGTYTYYVGARIETGRQYTDNELEKVSISCSSSECSIAVGEGQPAGGTFFIDQSSFSCSSQTLKCSLSVNNPTQTTYEIHFTAKKGQDEKTVKMEVAAGFMGQKVVDFSSQLIEGTWKVSWIAYQTPT